MIHQAPQTDPARPGGDGDVLGMSWGSCLGGNEVTGESSPLVPKQRPTLNQSLLRPCGVQLWLEFRIDALGDGAGADAPPRLCVRGTRGGETPLLVTFLAQGPVVGLLPMRPPPKVGALWAGGVLVAGGAK